MKQAGKETARNVYDTYAGSGYADDTSYVDESSADFFDFSGCF